MRTGFLLLIGCTEFALGCSGDEDAPTSDPVIKHQSASSPEKVFHRLKAAAESDGRAAIYELMNPEERDAVLARSTVFSGTLASRKEGGDAQKISGEHSATLTKHGVRKLRPEDTAKASLLGT